MDPKGVFLCPFPSSGEETAVGLAPTLISVGSTSLARERSDLLDSGHPPEADFGMTEIAVGRMVSASAEFIRH